MKNRKVILAALAVTFGLAAAGCGQQSKTGTWNANINSVYVTQAMEVESALVYSSDQFNELYNRDELAEFAKAAVAEYNSENGAEAAAENTEGKAKLPVALKSCSLEGRTGVLIFDYAAPEYFTSFAEASEDDTHTITSLAVQKVAEAEGISEAAFTDRKGKAVTAENVVKKTDAVAVIVEGAGTIFTEGKILYVAGDQTPVEIKDDFTAATGEGKSYIIFQQ